MIHGRKECWWKGWKVELLQQFRDGSVLLERKTTGLKFRVPKAEIVTRIEAI